jgi:hypothetical protein
MAQFDRKSRYVLYAETRLGVDARGRQVPWVTPARIPAMPILGEHRMKQGQRLDRLAAHYLDDPLGGWKVLHANDAITPEQVVHEPLVSIPVKVN